MLHLQYTFVLALIGAAVATSEVIRARAYVFKSVPAGLPSQIVGTIDFEQSGSFLKLNGSVDGLPAGEHGFHIHEKGDVSDACMGAGPHYNPHKLNHGGPDDSNRHIGDLGNVLSPPSGRTPIAVSDSLASLTGPYSIVGRSVVLHEKVDDLGRGGSDQSKTTGNAGGRLACGVIGIIGEVEVETTTAPLPPFNLPQQNQQGNGQVGLQMLVALVVCLLVASLNVV